MNNKAIFNRAPLPDSGYAPLPLTAIKPRGWLQKQLAAQAEGLSGHLYEIWPYVSDDTAWLGGDGDAWERAPYYLDGLLPLALLTGDEKLTERAKRHIEWILSSQREDGQFGPESNDDYWPRSVALKALMQYYTATTDRRVPEFMLKYFKYQYGALAGKPLTEWAVARAGENMLCAMWLYDLTGAKFLLRLCDKLRAQSLDWAKFFDTFPYTRSMSVHRPVDKLDELHINDTVLTGTDKPYQKAHWHYSHVVNVAMALKYPALDFLLHGSKKDLQLCYTGWEKLMKYHGVANGIFTGDEHLSGNRPTQGTELCAVVEAMYSFEMLAWLTGDMSMYDRLEKLAFNALPATISRDMRAHQYDQQVNQVRCSCEPRPWYNNGQESNLFGLEPNFGCCTANMHQGWPKYAESLWLATSDGGLAAMSYAPCEVRFRAAGQSVRITVDSEYPFMQRAIIRVELKTPTRFALRLRVPAWCSDFTASCAGQTAQRKNGIALLDREWHTGDEVVVELPFDVETTHWYHQSRAIEAGPLLMALPISEDWRPLHKRADEYDDYEVWPLSDWNYGLALSDEDAAELRLERTGAEPGFIYDEPPYELRVNAVRLPSWGMNGGSCADPPIGETATPDRVEQITLTPYGCSRLHIGQFPHVEVIPADE